MVGWVNHGRDHTNRRFAADEVMISPSTVSRLKLKWEFSAGRDITATPAVADGVVYFPCWNGYIYAVDAGDGSLVWKKKLEELTGFRGTGLVANVTVTVSRATPVVASPELLIVGIYGPAAVAALHRWTGELVWLTRLDSHFAAVVTMSGTAHDGLLTLFETEVGLLEVAGLESIWGHLNQTVVRLAQADEPPPACPRGSAT
ncbi:hypothetical protein ACLOJK_040529 [Asimina triloba]